MRPHSILERFNAAGFTLVLEVNSKIRVSPANNLTDDLRTLLRGNKFIIISEIRKRDTHTPKMLKMLEGAEGAEGAKAGEIMAPSGRQSIRTPFRAGSAPRLRLPIFCVYEIKVRVSAIVCTEKGVIKCSGGVRAHVLSVRTRCSRSFPNGRFDN